jgi:hypothetical protein
MSMRLLVPQSHVLLALRCNARDTRVKNTVRERLPTVRVERQPDERRRMVGALQRLLQHILEGDEPACAQLRRSLLAPRP